MFTGNTTGRETHVLADEKLYAPEGKGPCREIYFDEDHPVNGDNPTQRKV
jgi:hypothetical protein